MLMNRDAQRWEAVQARNSTFDGQFWYGVMTTGVYCRPSCASRPARRENVRFFDTVETARQSGLRACKRCKPDASAEAPTLSTLLDLCRYIDAHPDSAHTLTALAKRSGLSQFQVHRLFKGFLQITPKAYIEQVRVAALKQRLRSAPSVTDAIYDAGFESSSALYGRLDAHLGMTPKSYRRGGSGVDISFAFAHTPLGQVLMGATDRGVCYLQFGASDRELLEQLYKEYPKAVITPSAATSSKEFSAWVEALNRQLQSGRSSSALPLDIQGTAFQKRVWEFLRTIPAGDVVSYSEVAAAIDAPNAIRAVASACAGNRIGVLIPCHRVIRSNGELGGYRWGLPRKRSLIDTERRSRALKKAGDSKTSATGRKAK
jgi:AraC family transcriptional regulator of adaptative response/methylated-DNA-[protein]-cysteine methyltransferase